MDLDNRMLCFILKSLKDRQESKSYMQKKSECVTVSHLFATVEGGDPFLDSEMEKKSKVTKQKERERKNKIRQAAVKRTSLAYKGLFGCVAVFGWDCRQAPTVEIAKNDIFFIKKKVASNDFFDLFFYILA